jgi:hypothetical protein
MKGGSITLLTREMKEIRYNYANMSLNVKFLSADANNAGKYLTKDNNGNPPLNVKFLSTDANNVGKSLTKYKGPYINNTPVTTNSNRNISLNYTCQQRMLKSTLSSGK